MEREHPYNQELGSAPVPPVQRSSAPVQSISLIFQILKHLRSRDYRKPSQWRVALEYLYSHQLCLLGVFFSFVSVQFSLPLQVVLAIGLMALKPRIASPALTLTQLARLCVAIKHPAHSSIHVLKVVSVHTRTRQVFKAGTTMDCLFGEMRAQILHGEIQPVCMQHHVRIFSGNIRTQITSELISTFPRCHKLSSSPEQVRGRKFLSAEHGRSEHHLLRQSSRRVRLTKFSDCCKSRNSNLKVFVA